MDSILTQWLADPTKIGATGVLMAAIYSLWRGYFVTAGHHRQVIEAHENSQIVLTGAYEKRIEELTTDRNDYKAMLRDAVIGWKKTLEEKGAPPRERSS